MKNLGNEEFIRVGKFAAEQYEKTGRHITMAEFNDWIYSLAVDLNAPLMPCHN